jgi:predicted 2-oxoglutarate/Fe(II)-dependent dioxygenase YbiX
MKDIWWLGTLDSFSTDITLEDLKQECSQLPLQVATTGEQQGTLRLDERRSTIGFNSNFKSKTHKLLNEIAFLINQEYFAFDIDRVDEAQFSIYNEKNLGKYDWHIDTTFANNKLYQRKISIVIQLTDSNKYEGGNIELDGRLYGVDWNNFKEFARNKGAVIVFPTFIPHRVTEVTKGTRHSLIGWVTGKKFK